MGSGIRRERLGWDIASGALFAVIVLLAGIQPEDFPGARWMLIAVAAGILAVYALGARRYLGIYENVAEPGPAVSVGLQAALIALLAIGVAIEPNMLILQTLVLPLLWMTSRETRQAIIATLLNAAVLGVAYASWSGFTLEGAIAGFLTTGLSAAFAVAIGLWITHIAQWGTERQRLLAELTAAQASLEAASREAGATAERARLARDVHDTIAQSLTSIVMLAERARRDGSPATIELIEDAAREALREARSLVAVTSSPQEESGSLADALRRLGDRFTRETGVTVTVTASDVALPRDLQVVLLRCAQEGLANVRKHAGAATASVTLDVAAETTLTVRDDGRGLGGVGIDDDRGFGLPGMRERVELVGGTLTIHDRDGRGAELVVRVPRPQEVVS